MSSDFDFNNIILYAIPFIVTFIIFVIVYLLLMFTSLNIYDIVSFVGIICAAGGFLTWTGYNMYSIYKMYNGDTTTNAQNKISIPQHADLVAVPFIMNFSIVGFFIWFILYWKFTKTNWNTEKCKKNNFYFAPLFGEDSEKTFNDCFKTQSTGIVNDALTPLIDEIKSLENDILKLKNNGCTSINNGQGTNQGTGTGTNQGDTTGTGNGIGGGTASSNSKFYSQVQKNIKYMNNALNKIIGSAIASQYVMDGAIKTSEKIKNSSMVNVLNDISTSAKTVAETVENNNSTLGAMDLGKS